MDLPVIRSAASADRERAVGALVLAFACDPVLRWMYPEPRRYLEAFPDIIQAFGGRAFEHDSAYHAPDFAGAALWLPPGVGIDEESLVAVLERTIEKERQPTVFAILEQMGRHHPNEPHWYLPLIGVDAARQRSGYGAALMRHALVPVDRDRKAAYLESTNPRNLSLYERHGFEQVAKIEVEGAPPMFPMVRPAV